MPAREVIHDRFNCFFHPLIGLPPVYAAGLAATQGHHIQENSTSFFRNGGRPSGVIEIPGSITEENAKKLKSNWDSGYTGENAGKTAILSNGAKYNPTTFSPVDAQTVEQLKMTAEIVCSVFRVPAYKIGVGQPPSSDNVEALEQQYYSQCLQTLIESIELLLDEALETGENESTEFDVTTLLRMDSERRMKTLGDAVKNTLLTPNEARKREKPLYRPAQQRGLLPQRRHPRRTRKRREPAQNPQKRLPHRPPVRRRHRHHLRLLQKMRRPDRRQQQRAAPRRHPRRRQRQLAVRRRQLRAKVRRNPRQRALRQRQNGQRILHPPWRLRMRARRKRG